MWEKIKELLLGEKKKGLLFIFAALNSAIGLVVLLEAVALHSVKAAERVAENIMQAARAAAHDLDKTIQVAREEREEQERLTDQMRTQQALLENQLRQAQLAQKQRLSDEKAMTAVVTEQLRRTQEEQKKLAAKVSEEAAQSEAAQANATSHVIVQGEFLTSLAAGDPFLACAISECSGIPLSREDHVEAGQEVRIPQPDGARWNWAGCMTRPHLDACMRKN
jgi:nucleoid-associated protein YgaU